MNRFSWAGYIGVHDSCHPQAERVYYIVDHLTIDYSSDSTTLRRKFICELQVRERIHIVLFPGQLNPETGIGSFVLVCLASPCVISLESFCLEDGPSAVEGDDIVNSSSSTVGILSEVAAPEVLLLMVSLRSHCAWIQP